MICGAAAAGMVTACQPPPLLAALVLAHVLVGPVSALKAHVPMPPSGEYRFTWRSVFMTTVGFLRLADIPALSRPVLGLMGSYLCVELRIMRMSDATRHHFSTAS